MRLSRGLGGVAIGAAILLAGCTHNPIPAGYTGPTARVVDTIEPQDTRSAYVFFVNEIDGQRVDNASTWIAQANAGNGLTLRIYKVDFSRNVPAAPATFAVIGQIQYAAPIQMLLNPTR